MSTEPSLMDLLKEGGRLLQEQAKTVDKLLTLLERDEHFLKRRVELEVNGARAEGYRLKQGMVLTELGQTRDLAWNLFSLALDQRDVLGFDTVKEIARLTHMHVCFVDRGEHHEVF